MAAFLAFTLTGLGLFYLQNLFLLPQVRLRLLELLVFYVGLRPSFPVAFWVAVALGALQDSYAATPFGLQVGALLFLVALARICRRQFIFSRKSSQFLVPLAALALQELAWLVLLPIAGSSVYVAASRLGLRALEIVGTAALGPLFLPLMHRLEKLLGRHGWSAQASASS